MTQLTYENEREIKIMALAGAFAINLLLLAILLFVKLSYAVPQPPPIEYVEVNFGTDRVGSGRIQTYNRASNSPRAEDVKRAESRPKATPTPRTERTPAPPTPRPVAAPTRSAPEKIITSRTESPVSEPERPEPKRAAEPAPRPAPARVEPVRKPDPIDQNALFKRSSGGATGGNGTTGRASGTGGNNNGDDASGVGDKGNPNGKLDAKEFYGKPGGSASGVNLDMAGWALASRPVVNDDSDETGKIVFQLKVDQNGDIVSVRTLQTTVSPAVVDVYRRAVQRLQLRPKAASAPPISTGTITFIIKSR